MDKAAVERAEAFKKHIGKVIKKNRERCGKIQYDLASELGVKKSTISRYEAGKSEIKASTMALISHMYDFDLIEYIPSLDNVTAAAAFRRLTRMTNINPRFSDAAAVQEIRRGAFRDIHVMDFVPGGRSVFSAEIKESQKKTKPKTDILTEMPKTQPLPLCDDDNEAFEYHMMQPYNRDRLRILLYGYRLMMLFQEMDSSQQTTSSMTKQILRRLIKDRFGEIDQDVYNYYWKCVYSDR